MLDYTRVALNQIISDFKKIAYIAGVATQILYILYLIYAIAANTGILWVNIILLTLSVAYFVFSLIIQNKKITDKQQIKSKKSIHRTAKKIYKYSKLILLILKIPQENQIVAAFLCEDFPVGCW